MLLTVSPDWLQLLKAQVTVDTSHMWEKNFL